MNGGAQLQRFLVWQAPGKTVEAHLSFGVVDRLAFAVSEGVQALPRRGLEIGGLLLGRARRAESGIVVDVEDFEPIECEHAVGPSYLLTAKDREFMEERIRVHKSSGNLEVVGAFRSHTRKEFSLTPEDLDFLSAYFARPADVFLLIHALRDCPLTAGFAIREDGKIQSLTPQAPFPLRSAALESGAYQLRSVEAPVAAPTPAERPAPRQAPELPVPAATLVAQAPPHAIVLVIQFPQLPSLAQWRSTLKSKWLTAASALAVLVLAAAWLRPSMPPAQAIPARVIAASVSGPVSAPSQPIAVEPSRPSRTQGLPERTHIEYRDRSIAPEEPASAPRAMSPLPRLAAKPPDRQSVLPEPPAATLLLSSNFKTPSVLRETLTPAPPPAADPFVNVTIASEAPDLGDFFDAPARVRSRAANFIAPKPLRQAQAEVPVYLRQRMKHEIPIDVRVYVNAAGRVEFAELTSGASGLKKDLGAIAVFSSRQWIFAPATSGLQNVPSEVVLRYRFGAGLH